MKMTFAILLLLLSVTTFAQSFEGEIDYKNSYKSKSPAMSDQQLTDMLGATQNYFMKGGDYKSVMNGKMMEWQLYINKDNKVYNKMAPSPTVYWTDAAANDDEVLKSELNKGAATIMGYTCDELVLTCKSGVQKYYFNSKFSVDPKLYSKHAYGNWYAYLLKSNAVPLKMTIDSPQFFLESVAISIKPGKLDDKMFVLDPSAHTEKSPY